MERQFCDLPYVNSFAVKLCTILESQQLVLFLWLRQERMLFEMSCTTEILHLKQVQLFAESHRASYDLALFKFMR